MVVMFDKPTESLKDRRIKNAEKACRESRSIGQRIFGIMCSLNYVRCMTREAYFRKTIN